MINTHKELVSEIRNFAEKMPLIKDFKYLKDAERIQEEVGNSEPRILVVGLEGVTMDDENYNMTATYSFIISDKTRYEDDSILESETDNMFCVSSLGDYLNYLHDSPIEFQAITFITESDQESTYISVSGRFEFTIKRTASYWKKMEAYSTP